MRIIGGKLRGTLLHFPKNGDTRPLKDLARESIFNVLTHSSKISFKIDQARILDLYAGTGSFGLECLSRQAKEVCFVEKEKNVINILNKNIQKLKFQKETKIFLSDIFILIKKKNIFKLKFDLIFCDPPFKNKNIEELIELIFTRDLLQKGGILILHRKENAQDKFPNYFKIIEERTYGLSKINFGKMLA